MTSAKHQWPLLETWHPGVKRFATGGMQCASINFSVIKPIRYTEHAPVTRGILHQTTSLVFFAAFPLNINLYSNIMLLELFNRKFPIWPGSCVILG